MSIPAPPAQSVPDAGPSTQKYSTSVREVLNEGSRCINTQLACIHLTDSHVLAEGQKRFHSQVFTGLEQHDFQRSLDDSIASPWF